MADEENTLLLIIKVQDDASEELDTVEDKTKDVQDAVVQAAAMVKAAAAVMDKAMAGFSDQMIKTAVTTKVATDEIKASFTETAAAAPVVDAAEKALGDTLKDSTKDFDDQGNASGSWRDKLSTAFTVVTGAYDKLTAHIPLLKKAIDDDTDASNKNAKGTGSMGDSAQAAESKMSDLSGKIRLVALAAAAMSGPVEGLLSLGVPAMFGAMALGAEKLNTSLKAAEASGTALTSTQKMLLPLSKTLNSAFANLGPVVKSTFSTLIGVIQSLGPSLKVASQALGPMIQVIGAGLGQFLTQLIPPLAQMMTKMLPVVQALATGLGKLGGGIAGLFTNLNLGAEQQGITQIFSAIAAVLPMIGKFLTAFVPLADIIASTLAPALAQLANTFLSVLTPVLQKSATYIKPLAATLASLAQTFSAVIRAVGPLINPILQVALAFSNFDTTLEAIQPLFGAIGTALGPIISLIGQIATLVTTALNTAFSQLATAVIPLIPALGQLANAALSAVLQILTALLPILPALVNAVVELLPSVISLVPVFTQLVSSVTPLLVLLARLIVDIVNPLIASLGKLGPVLHVVLLAFIGLMAISKLVQVFQLVGVAFQALKLIMVTNPFLALAIAVIAITVLIVTHWTPIKAFFIKLWGDIEKVFDEAVAWVTGVIKGWYPVILGVLSGGILLVPALIYKYWSQITQYVSDAWNSAIAWLKGVPGMVERALIGADTWLISAGEDLINGLIHGAENMAQTAINAVKGIGSDIVGGVKSILHIGSPSKIMADEVGAMIPAGIAQGILANAGVISSAISTIGAGTVKASVTHMLSSNALGSASVGSLGTAASGGGTYIDLRGSQIMSDRDMQDLIAKLGAALAKTIGPSGGLRVKM